MVAARERRGAGRRVGEGQPRMRLIAFLGVAMVREMFMDAVDGRLVVFKVDISEVALGS